MKTESKLSLYWRCQLIGWTVAALYWQYDAFVNGKFFFFDLAIIQFVTDILLYTTITHLYRLFSLHQGWQNLNLPQLVPRIIPAVIVMSLVYMVATASKLYVIRCNFWIDYDENYLAFMKGMGLNLFIAGTRLMSIWILAYHLYRYAQREIELAKINGELAVVARETQLNNLIAQLNPHLLFNSLNTIKALIIIDPFVARRGIDLLSELLRHSLYRGENMLTTVETEMSLVRDYLELESLRMEERLQFELEVQEQVNKQLIPRLCIQTLAENAIKHGIAQQKSGGKVLVHVSHDDLNLKIKVHNPGKLNYSAPQTGIGIKNLQKRLELTYHGRATFEINDHFDGSVTAIISIPIS